MMKMTLPDTLPNSLAIQSSTAMLACLRGTDEEGKNG